MTSGRSDNEDIWEAADRANEPTVQFETITKRLRGSRLAVVPFAVREVEHAPISTNWMEPIVGSYLGVLLTQLPPTAFAPPWIMQNTLWVPRTMTILSLARPPLRRDDHFRC